MDSKKDKRVSSQRKLKNSQTAGTVYSNVSSGATAYGEEKFHAIRGHGFAAERAIRCMTDTQDMMRISSVMTMRRMVPIVW